MLRFPWALFVTMLLLSGCAGSGAQKKPPATPQTAPSSPDPAQRAEQSLPAHPAAGALTPELLQNAAYPLPEANGNLIRFTEGRFRGPVQAGSLEEVRFVILERFGYGDLDGDGVADAALIMVKDPIGDKPVFTLWAVINQGGVPDPRSSILLGEKAQVGGITIEDQKIYVEVVRMGPNDVEGRPTRRIKESYKLFGNQLERADTFR